MFEHLQQHRSHKTIRAAKIVKIEESSSEFWLTKEAPDTQTYILELPNGGLTKVAVNIGLLVKKPTPEVGMYLVAYDDGYFSFSPAKSFEDGYTKIG